MFRDVGVGVTTAKTQHMHNVLKDWERVAVLTLSG